jgi:hypothetical protein
MSGPSRRFDPAELLVPGEPQASVADQAAALAAARELESLAAGDLIRPTDGFEDRVMAAVATEPAPRLMVRPGSAVRGGRPAAILLSIRDAWRIATTGGRPAAVRAQALAFVLLIVVAAGALTGGMVMTVGGLFDRSAAPEPSVAPTPISTLAPTPSASPLPSASPDASETPVPTMTASPAPTAEPTQTTKPGETARPTRTPRPTETPEPGETPEPTDDHGGGGGPGPGGGGPGPG